MANTRTLNQLIEAFRDIADRHQMVNHFYVGLDSDFTTDNKPTYPSLLVNPVSAGMPKTDNGFSMFSVNFEVKILDLLTESNDNQFEILSDGLETLKDIISEFTTHPNYVESDFNVENSLSFNVSRDVLNSDVAGWSVTITLLAPNRTSYCGSPITPLT